jgi:hypothetical protein
MSDLTVSENVDLFEVTKELFVSKIEEVYKDWQDGTIQSDQAINLFCKILGPLQEQEKMVAAIDKQVRGRVGEVLAFLGSDTFEIKGFGKLEITKPGVTYSYDKKLLDQLTNQLRTEGMGDVAARLDACLKSSERAGTLRITREKQAKE